MWQPIYFVSITKRINIYTTYRSHLNGNKTLEGERGATALRIQIAQACRAHDNSILCSSRSMAWGDSRSSATTDLAAKARGAAGGDAVRRVATGSASREQHTRSRWMDPKRRNGVRIRSRQRWIFMIYSLRSELLVVEMNVSRRILVLDTFISETSNSEQRE